eukprot:g17192.t1
MKMSASGKNKKQDKKQAGTRHDHESSSSKSKSSSSTSSASTGRSGGSSAATATATTEKKHHRSSHKEKEKVVEKNHYGPGFSFGVGYNQGYYPPPGPCGGCCMYGGGQAIFWILGMAAGLVGCVLLMLDAQLDPEDGQAIFWILGMAAGVVGCVLLMPRLIDSLIDAQLVLVSSSRP